VHKTIGKLAICRARSQHRVPFFPTFPYPRNVVTGPPRRRGGAPTNHLAVAGPAFTSTGNPTTAPPVLKQRRAAGRHASPRTKLEKPSSRRKPKSEIFFPPQLRSSPLLSREFVARSPESQRHLRSLGVEAELSDGFGARRRRFLGRCRGGLRRACGYRLCGAGSGWAPAKGSGSWNRALLRTLEVSVAALGVNFEVLPVFLD